MRSLDAPTDEAQLVSATLVRRGARCARISSSKARGRPHPRSAYHWRLLPPALRARSRPRGGPARRRRRRRGRCRRGFLRAHARARRPFAARLPRSRRERARADQAHRRRPRNPGFSRARSAGCRPRISARRARRAAVARLPDQLVRATGCGALLYDRWGSGESEPLSRPYSKDYLLDEALAAPRGALANPHFASNPDRPVRRRVDRARLCRKFSRARARGDRALAASLREEDAGGDRRPDRGLRARRSQGAARRHHGARTEALFARLVEVWTAAPAGAGWGLEEHRAVRCPVLAIQGEDDEFFGVAQLEALGRLLPEQRYCRFRAPGITRCIKRGTRCSPPRSGSSAIRLALTARPAARPLSIPGTRPEGAGAQAPLAQLVHGVE